MNENIIEYYLHPYIIVIDIEDGVSYYYNKDKNGKLKLSHLIDIKF